MVRGEIQSELRTGSGLGIHADVPAGAPYEAFLSDGVAGVHDQTEKDWLTVAASARTGGTKFSSVISWIFSPTSLRRVRSIRAMTSFKSTSWLRPPTAFKLLRSRVPSGS